MPTASAMGKTYCPQCGWNRAEAEKQTRLFLRLLPVLVIVFDAPLIAYIFLGRAEAPQLGLLAVLAIVPAILVVIVMRNKVSVEASARRAQGVAGTPSEKSSGDSAAAPDQATARLYASLTELQRPRQVRMSRQGKMSTATIVISVLMFAGVLIAMVLLHPGAPRVPPAGQSSIPPRSVVFVIPLCLMAAVVFFMRRSLVQQKWLLSMGEVALGRVTKTWTARNGNGVRYEFTTLTGETLSRTATDATRRLIPGMSLPVFYDPAQPKKQVAICVSFYEVVLPGE